MAEAVATDSVAINGVIQVELMDATLFHLDAHYDQIVRPSPLQATNLKPAPDQERGS